MTSAFVEQSLCISKASFDPQTQTMKFRMVSSDIHPDSFDERMSLELFNDFTSRIEKNAQVPEPYKSILSEKSGWQGGMPYVSVAHFKSGKDGANIPADTEKVYVDGECLKATAICRDTPLGQAVFKALKADLDGTSAYEDKIRVSIGFLDLSHSHGDYVFERKGIASVCPMCENSVGNKVYLKGVLVHNALTRVPANPRTDAEVDKSMTIKTKEEDAASIVGDEMASEIVKNKSVVDDEPLESILTVKAAPQEDTAEDEMGVKDHPADCSCKACADKKKEPMKSVVDEVITPVEVVAKTALEECFDVLKAKIVEYKSLPREEALKNIQPTFDAFGTAVQSEFAEEKSVAITASIDPALSELLTSMKSTLDAVNAKISVLSDEVTILKSQVGVTSKSVAPVVSDTIRRNLQVERALNAVDAAMAMKPRSILEIARASVQG